ncbi:MAG: alpha/beta fold hydrolase [Acidimicrobiales bacterium]
MRLTSRTTGPATGRQVTFLHGFTQTSDSWLPVLGCLPGVRATLIDAPGHGANADAAGNLWDTAAAVADAMPTGALVGYSMGARMALHVALARPGQVRSLVLVSGTPGIEDAAERTVRRESDDSLAAHIEQVGTRTFVDEWLANPMFAGLDDAAARRGDRYGNPAAGLAASLRLAGTGTQDDLWPRLAELQCPVLIVTGALDAKFTDIGARMVRMFPHAEHAMVADAGHTVHLEETEAFCGVLAGWLDRHGG